MMMLTQLIQMSFDFIGFPMFFEYQTRTAVPPHHQAFSVADYG